MIALIKFIYIISVGRHFLSFQTSLPHFEPCQQAWYHTYIPIYLSVEAKYLLLKETGSKVSSSSHSLKGIWSLALTGGGFTGILIFQFMSALLCFGKSINSGGLEVEHFVLSLAVLGELYIFSYVVSISSVKTSHMSIPTSDSDCYL